ncbi:PQQ-dependent sugar dehydrogenase [Bacteriovorax sp. Seq25_V]|uniref:PQQ-dependent sugar dehydrogenase n=1 Tax=Bacteriovorax sp. Seq25_V TaxID=1201288 RepID=UPI00038A31F5|nr:PQQ-dependent sugar dehydrogenase [Bacteriovorax sp. Seq25_V]EQC45385.1 putative soluble aldose sugar dehydrogenase YliI [Bacteriovorax sp. Seq25_V]
MKKKLIIVLMFMNSAVFGSVKLEEIASGLRVVWGMDFIDNETLIFTEKLGKLKILNLKTKEIKEISGAPEVYKRGQAGLLDIKLHPKFASNRRVYITYSKSISEDNITTAIGYGILEGLQLKDFKDIFVGKGNSSTGYHFGSRMSFSGDNTIYFTIGDRGQRDNAQNLQNHFGKVLHINDDGSIPKNNPFIDQKNALPEIWSYGHRNPQGLVYDMNSKTLYEMEHGPRGGDEINIIQKGKNYGWPLASYGKEYALPVSVGDKKVKGTEQPLKFYDPSIAPSGLIYYQGSRYSEFKNSLISGALKLTHMNVFNLANKKETRYFEDKKQRMRSIAISPDDYIYISTDGGKIYKVVQ